MMDLQAQKVKACLYVTLGINHYQNILFQLKIKL